MQRYEEWNLEERGGKGESPYTVGEILVLIKIRLSFIKVAVPLPVTLSGSQISGDYE